MMEIKEPVQCYGECFQALRLLKEGQGIQTWLGVDQTSQRQVVIKTLREAAIAPTLRHRLEHEARILRQVEGYASRGMLVLGQQNGLVYLVRPFIAGQTLAEVLKQGPLTLQQTLRVGCHLLELLDKVHSHDVVHRDIKPPNVVVDDPLNFKQAVLIDYGLARSGRIASSIHEQPVGTLYYMSPEQAGLIPAPIDERSDLYSVGILLFECLTGKPPFGGDNATEILRQHLTATVPDLTRSDVHAPRALEELIRRLLRKDPRERYQSARGVARDLWQIRNAVSRGDMDPALVIAMHDKRPTLTEPAFVGSKRELAVLEGALDAASQGEAQLVSVEALSGGGKSRLIEEFAHRAARRGAWIFYGQGLDASAQQPYQMLKGISQEVLTRVQTEPTLGERLREKIGDHATAVCHALPELNEILKPTQPATALGPEVFAELRINEALAKLLEALGENGQPAVVLLDDCQWADPAALKLLGYWAERRIHETNNAVHLLLVTTFRSEEVVASHALRKLHSASQVLLGPLEPAGIRQILVSMAGGLPEEAIQFVTRLAEGSPFMAGATLRGLVETGALQLSADGTWCVDASLMREAQASRRAAVFLANRLEHLPEQALRLLSVAAVLGRRFNLDLAAILAELSPADTMTAAHEVQRRQIVWAGVPEPWWVFVHDKLREALLARLTDDQRKGLHQRAAEWLEKNHSYRVFDISYHYDAAGLADKALPYALDAATQARTRNALDLAEEHFRIAARGCASTERDKCLHIVESLGDIRMFRGSYADAKEALEQALALAHDNPSRSRIQGKLGELAFKRGDVAHAGEHLESAMRLLGRFVPRSKLMFGLLSFWELLVQILHTLFPALLLARRPIDRSEAEFGAIRLYSRLAYIYWFGKGRIACFWAHQREMNLAERYPPTAELAQAYSEHAPVMTMIPYFSRGIRYAQKSFSIRQKLGDIWGQGQALHFHGIVLYASTRFQEAIDKCTEAVRLLEQTGDRWEINTANWHRAFCHYRLGQLQQAVDLAKHVHHTGITIGDAQAVGISLGCWAKASAGKTPMRLIDAELSRQEGDYHTKAELLQAEAIRLIAQGDALSAAERLTQAQQMIERAGLRQEYVVSLYPWRATAYRIAAEQTPLSHVLKRQQLLKNAQQALRKGLVAARYYRNNLPHALREKALLCAIFGKTQQARRFFAQSLAVATEQHAQYEYAQSLLARGQVGLGAKWEDAQADIEQAQKALQALQPEADTADTQSQPVTLSLADRFDQILETGRTLVNALSEDEVFEAARRAALVLLRGQQCTVLRVDTRSDDNNENRGQATYQVAHNGTEDINLSEKVIQRALQSSKTVVYAEDSMADLSESIILGKMRSIVCTPIKKRGQIVACLYVTHYEIGRLFGSTEERLSEFIATLAGAALENAEGFANIRSVADERARLYDEAQQAILARDAFISIASHELKTPVTVLKLKVRSIVRLLTHDQLDEKERIAPAVDKLSALDHQLNRLTGLIDQLLNVSRITMGRFVLEHESVDLSALTQQVAARFEEELSRAKCDLTIKSPKSVVGFWDPQALEHVLSNLISNSIKYGAGKPITLSVIPKGERVILSVRDEGIGIKKEDQKRIFERFERAVSGRHYSGFGIGLWIVNSMVQEMGGRIEVESVYKNGSTFIVTLPKNHTAPPEVNN